MALANIFTSLTVPPEGVTPPHKREEGKRGPDNDHDKNDWSSKRPLPAGQPGGPMKKKRKRTGAQQMCQRPNSGDHLMKMHYNKPPALDFRQELQAWTSAKNHYRNTQKADHSRNVQAKHPGPSNGVWHQDRELQDAERPWKRTNWEPDQQSHGSWRGNSSDRHDGRAYEPGGFASTRGRGFPGRGGQGVDRGRGRGGRGRGRGRGQRASDSPENMGDRSWTGDGRGQATDRRGHGPGAPRSLRGGQTPPSGRPEKAPVVESKRRMTQQFKDQNVIEMDGKFICKHFLRGNCLKADECQLEHPAAFQNSMLKEACKFYVRGYCFSGASCPYMHQDFPCKFFHSRGKCMCEDECRFSHEPLTDLTRRLLDEALEKEKELILARSMSTDPPTTTEDAVTSDPTKPLIDISLPLTLSFYNSSGPSEPDAEKSAPLWNKAVSSEAAEKETPHTHTPPALNPPRSPSGTKEPASYSIEAVLGSRRLFDAPKPCSVFTPPVSQPSPGHCSQRSPDRTSSSADGHGKAPELLRSHGHQEEPPRGLFAGATSSARLTAPMKRSADVSDVSTSDKTVVGSDKPIETPYQKLFSSPLGQSSPPNRQANVFPDPSHGGRAPLSPPDKSALGTPKPQNKSFLSLFAGPIGQATAPKRPAQTKPHTPTTPPGPPEQTPNPPHPPRSTDGKRTASRFSETVVSSNPHETPFRSLFSGPIGQSTTPQPPNPAIPDALTTPSCHKDSIHTPAPPPSPRESKNKPSKTPFHDLFSGLDRTPPTGPSPNPPTNSSGNKGEVPCSRESPKSLEKPFCSLFASPISEVAAPRSQTRTKPEPVDIKTEARLPDPTSDREPAKTSSVLKSLFLRLSPRRHEGEQGDRQKLDKDTGSDALGLGGKCKSTRGSACTENQRQKEAEERMEEVEGQARDKKVPKVSVPLTSRSSLCDPPPLGPVLDDLTPPMPLSHHPQNLVPDSEAFGPCPPPRDSVSQKAAVAERPPLQGHVRAGTSGCHNLPVRLLAPMTRPHPTPRTAPRKTRAQNTLGTDRPLKDLFSTYDPTASPFGQQLFTQ